MRTQLELPRQPSEGCSVGALGPREAGERLWSRRRGSNIIKIDGWPLPELDFAEHASAAIESAALESAEVESAEIDSRFGQQCRPGRYTTVVMAVWTGGCVD